MHAFAEAIKALLLAQKDTTEFIKTLAGRRLNRLAH
jgi:hypothetical protein